MPVCVECNVLPVYMLMLKNGLYSVKSSPMCVCVCVCVDEVHTFEDCMFLSLQFPVLHPSTSQSVPPLRGLLW